MATARINLTVDETTKEEALKLFDAFGMDASTAVNMFFKISFPQKSPQYILFKCRNRACIKT